MRKTLSLVLLPSKNEKGLDKPDSGNIQPFSVGYVRGDLALADSEHFRTAHRAHALGRRFTIFHGYHLSIFHFLLRTTFHTISLHVQASSRSFALTIYYLTHPSQADALFLAK
jgi:hypothetical protein